MNYNLSLYWRKHCRWGIPGLAFAVPGLAYLMTMAPGLTWAYHGGDGGDLITAAYTLGIPHPPGYPTYVLIGWLFSKVPLGSIGWRFNLLSAIAIAGAAWLIFRIVRRLTNSELAGLVAAWTFAFVPLVWSQAIITEVYGLNLFFVSLLIWLGVQIRQGKEVLAFWLGLVFGLALGSHLGTLFLLPILAFCLFKRRWPARVKGILGASTGLLIFIYLPVRANQGAITWGTPDTPGGFWALVTGQLYRAYWFSVPLETVITRMIALVGYLAGLGIVGLILLGLGVHRTFSRSPWATFWVMSSAAVYVICALGYKSIDSYVYLLPVFVLMAIGIGLGVPELMRFIPAGRPYFFVAAVLVGLPLLIGMGNGHRLSLRNDDVAQEYWQTIMSQAPSNAILLTSKDTHTFALWYAQHVLGQRSDVAIVDTNLLAYPWYQRQLRRTYPLLAEISNLPALPYSEYSGLTCTVLETENSGKWQLACLSHRSK